MSADSQRVAAPPGGEEPGLAKGAAIGRYVVLGLLGRGGMGEVYAAYDPELDRKIAVKLLRTRVSGLSAEDGRTRLLREAQAIARLSHPNVVVVYDVGTFNESVFIAMEFVEGNTLGYWLQAAKRSWREVLDVFLAAGRGLVAAHAAGLVHRDFKPENVMLTKSGQVRVMDFGLARELDDGDGADGAGLPSPATQLSMDAAARLAAAQGDLDLDPDATAKLGDGAGSDIPSASGRYLEIKLTQTGAMLGTPAYMAPEQFAGSGGDARADQFAFCVALYEGLYGRRPFEGDTPLALMANVVAGTVTDPPADSKVPAWLRKLLLRGLATSRDDRFPSMTELLAELSRDPAGRRRRWLGAAAGVLVAAGALAGAHRFTAGQRALCAGGPARAAAVWDAGRRGAIQRAFAASGSKHAAQVFGSAAALVDRYIERWTAMYGESCEATHVRGEQSAEVLDLRMSCLGDRLSSVRALGEVLAAADASVVDNAVAAAAALPTLDRCADVPALRAVIKIPEDPATRMEVARLREEVAKINALAAAGRCEEAKKTGGPIQTAARKLAYLPVEAEIDFALGRQFDACMDTKEAVADLEDAVMAAETSRHDEIAIDASAVLGSAYSDRLHEAPLARHWIRHAEALLARYPGHPLLEARVAASRGNVLYGEARFDEALREQQRALALQEPLLGPSSIDVGMTTNNVAIILHELGRDAEAEVALQRAIAIFVKLLGEDTGRTALASLNLGEIQTALGKFDAANAALEKAMAIWKQEAATSFLTSVALLYQGRLRLVEKKPGAAVPLLERSLELQAGQDPHFVAEMKFALAQALALASPAGRRRAIELAADAHATLARDPASQRQTRAIEAWQQDHPAR